MRMVAGIAAMSACMSSCAKLADIPKLEMIDSGSFGIGRLPMLPLGPKASDVTFQVGVSPTNQVMSPSLPGVYSNA